MVKMLSKYTPLCAAVQLAALLLFLPATAKASIEADSSSAVVFSYQRVGEDTMPHSSISTDRFREHIRELKTAGYSVLPLPRIIEAVNRGEMLPHKTVAITFDGAYASTQGNALAFLDEAEIPYTLFFSSDMADGPSPGHLGWDQLKALKRKKGVSLGILPSAYAHLINNSPEANAALINKAVSKYRENFGEEPQFFSWPYGEYSSALKKQIETYGFKASFGQQSGVVYAGADFLALPRFTMTDNFGDLDRFRLTANALPLPVSGVTPEDTILAQNPPMIGFTVTPEIQDLSKLSCFISGIGKVGIVKPGGNRTEIRIEEPFIDRRTRVNCTLPDDTVIPGEAPSWRWFGMLLVDTGYAEEETVTVTATEGIE